MKITPKQDAVLNILDRNNIDQILTKKYMNNPESMKESKYRKNELK